MLCDSWNTFVPTSGLCYSWLCSVLLRCEPVPCIFIPFSNRWAKLHHLDPISLFTELNLLKFSACFVSLQIWPYLATLLSILEDVIKPLCNKNDMNAQMWKTYYLTLPVSLMLKSILMFSVQWWEHCDVKVFFEYFTNPWLSSSAADVRKTFKRVNPHKAAGPDGIPSRALSACADQLAGVFTDIFNQSLA